MGQSLSNAPGVNQTTVLNALVPPEGPKSTAVYLDFTTVDQIDVDFTLATSQALITTIQAIVLDNSANDASVNFQVSGTLQSITAPARSMGVYVVVATNRPKFLVTCEGAVTLTPLFLNVPLPTNVWFPGDTDESAAAGLAHTIAVGGTAVTVFNPPGGGGGRIINPFDATESLFLDIVNAPGTTAPGASGTTFELVAGQQFDIPAGFGGIVRANAVTNGHAFTAYSWG